jgi:hypothetical protein
VSLTADLNCIRLPNMLLTIYQQAQGDYMCTVQYRLSQCKQYDVLRPPMSRLPRAASILLTLRTNQL